uniref:Uncharacterized protein n=1 Tax=Rhizophora mucronata TaxID=61149 RepID=A0A2P2Q805_RHIMU
MKVVETCFSSLGFFLLGLVREACVLPIIFIITTYRCHLSYHPSYQLEIICLQEMHL